MRMTVGKKLYLGFGIVLLLTLIIGLVGINTLKRTNNTWKDADERGFAINEKSMDFMIALLNSRRAEKDFMLRYKDKGIEKAKEEYIDTKLKEHIETAQKDLADIKNIEAKAGEMQDVARVEKIEGLLDNYRSGLLEVIGLIEKRGHKDTGIEGELRDAIYKVEAEVEKAGLIEIERDMLMCRRHEKDFLLRGEEEYVKKHTESVDTLKTKINESTLEGVVKSELIKLADDYQTGFTEVVMISSEIKVKIDEFRESAHTMEELAAEIELEGHRMAEERIGFALGLEKVSNRVIVVALVLIIIFGFVAALIITRGITRPLGIVVNRIIEIAGSAGDLTRTVSVTTKDEIGDLGNAFNRMLDGLKSMVTTITNTAERVSSSSQQMSSGAQCSLSAVRISSPNFMAPFSLAIERKPKFSNYINHFSICNSRKMFTHDRYLYCNGYRYLKTELGFAFSNNCREEFAVVFSALNMDPNYILDIINNLGIRIAFSMAPLKCQTFCKISSLFTRFYYYWKKIYLFHFHINILIHDVKKVKDNFPETKWTKTSLWWSPE